MDHVIMYNCGFKCNENKMQKEKLFVTFVQNVETLCDKEKNWIKSVLILL